MQTKEERLALELADALNDMEALPLYTAFAQKYSEAHLRKLLQRVLSIPESQIRKTRGALFTYLVGQNYGNRNGSRD
ncbi:hypothetical protein GCM10023093_07350 [Nemorincola caseinilytica]|uniref:Uncharacterized protein n=1 Tax=Nemorincola caseinilytica TaxID=2054315 RepID=A0ABP8NA46_9BACT